MFKVGDWVCMNPKYFIGVPTIWGIISNEKAPWDSKQNIIDWEDGKQGGVYLDTKDPYVLLV